MDTESKIIHFMGSNKYIIPKIKCWPVFKQDPIIVCLALVTNYCIPGQGKLLFAQPMPWLQLLYALQCPFYKLLYALKNALVTIIVCPANAPVTNYCMPCQCPGYTYCMSCQCPGYKLLHRKKFIKKIKKIKIKIKKIHSFISNYCTEVDTWVNLFIQAVRMASAFCCVQSMLWTFQTWL